MSRQLTEEQFCIKVINSASQHLNDKILSLTTLRCKICKGIPSCPIMTYENGNLCGNCYHSDACTGAVRNTTLENILSELKLPCEYENNGCNDKLTYLQFLLHKNGCVYRNFNCPLAMYKDCGWKGKLTSLKEHMESYHLELFLKKHSTNDFFTVAVNIVKSNESHSLFLIDEKLFLLQIICNVELQKCWFIVYYIGMNDIASQRCYTVETSIKLGWYAKFEGKCLNFENYYDKKKKITAEADISILKEISDTISIRVHITQNEQDNKYSDKLLANLICLICKNYMRAPINQCTVGHNLCQHCRSKVNKCPLCKNNFGNSRNYALESISNAVYLPCSYYDLGCKEKIIGEQIENHENKCIFKPYKCPLKILKKCTWENSLSALSTHLEQCHHDNFVCADNIVIEIVLEFPTTVYGYPELYNYEERSYYYKFCMKAKDEIFCVHYICTKGNDSWSVKIISSEENHKKYKYEVILLMDSKNDNDKVTFTKLCNNLIYIPHELLRKFYSGGKTKYNIKIRHAK